MNKISIGYPEFLLVGGIVLHLMSPGFLAMTLISLSVISAIARTSLSINFRNKEEERKDAEENRKQVAEDRINKIIDQLATTNQLNAAASLSNLLSGQFDGGDNNGGHGPMH